MAPFLASCVGGAAVTLIVTALTLRWDAHAAEKANAMISSLSGIWVFLAKSPLLWLTVTLLIYLAALWLYRRSGVNPFWGHFRKRIAGYVNAVPSQ